MHSFHFNANFNLLAAQPLDLFDINLLRLNPPSSSSQRQVLELHFDASPAPPPPTFSTSPEDVPKRND